MEKKLQARTVQGYLHSINAFLNFYRDFISPGEMEKNIHVDSLIRKVGNMMSSYNEAKKLGNGKKEDEDLQNLLESADIYKFEKSKKSVEAKLVLQIVLQKLIAVSKFPEIFCSVRTFIMAMIYLKNANRPEASNPHDCC